jgi:hypothetical protein
MLFHQILATGSASANQRAALRLRRLFPTMWIFKPLRPEKPEGKKIEIYMRRKIIWWSFENDVFQCGRVKIKMFFRYQNREPVIFLDFLWAHVFQKPRFSSDILLSKSKIAHKRTSVGVTPVPNWTPSCKKIKVCKTPVNDFRLQFCT